MRRFKNLLAVLDGSERDDGVASRAVRLAKENRASLKLVEAVDVDPPIDEIYFATNILRPDLFKIATEAATERLKARCEQLSGELPDLSTKVLSGTPFIEISREVERFHHDLVLISSEDESTVSSRLLGSTCRRLMRKCAAPVWGIHSTAEHTYARVLAAVSVPHDENDTLNEHLMGMAETLAQMESSEIHVVHIWKPEGLTVLENQYDYAGQVAEWVEHLELSHKRWFDAFMERQAPAVSAAQRHFLEGEPGLVIPQLAEEIGADLIVMGTVCRTGLKGFFIGNTAEKVLNHAKVSLLTVKPAGFESPFDFGRD